MSDHQDAHGELFEQIACSVCDKPPGMSVEECFESKNKPLCQKDGKCRIFEKTEMQLRYVGSPLGEKVFLTACPGSGKTEVVGLKAAYETKRWEHKYTGIAFLTFTNNAATVIRDRVTQVAGIDAVGYPHYIGTIDSWLHRYIAQPFSHLITGYLGIDGDRSIRIISDDLDTGWINNYACISRYWFYDDSGRLKSKSIFANQIAFDISDNLFYIRVGRGNNISHIDYYDSRPFQDFIKDKGWLTRAKFEQGLGDCVDQFHRDGFATYRGIEALCFSILGIPEISSRLASRFPFIIIDECQDLSGNQLKIIEMLIHVGVSVHFVGDLEQSIFSFKGVNPSVIQDFASSNEFSELILVDNFRSSQPIVDLCCKLVDQEGVFGWQECGEDIPVCIYFTYNDDADMANLPEKFVNILEARNDIDVNESAILARNYNIIGKIRSHGDYRQKSPPYFPASAINTWNVSKRSLEQTEEAISLMGKFLAERLFSSSSSNSRRYYCPECVSSSIQWRVFLAGVLSECCNDDSLIDFQQQWSQWGRNFRDSIDEILQRVASKFDTITLPENIRTTLRYRIPGGQSNNAVADSLLILPDRERKNIRITTFHKIKGETLDAALVVSSRTGQGRGGGYWLKWLEDTSSENARFAYVASSRPKHLLAWAIPAQSLDDDNRAVLDGLGFIEE